jgi:hypothetical protein
MQFLCFRWLWRLFLWFQFLESVRKLDLQLFPTHPDQAAGWVLLARRRGFFGVLLFAFSAAAAGVIANDIVYGKLPLKSFAPSIGTYVVVAVIIVGSASRVCGTPGEDQAHWFTRIRGSVHRVYG